MPGWDILDSVYTSIVPYRAVHDFKKLIIDILEINHKYNV